MIARPRLRLVMLYPLCILAMFFAALRLAYAIAVNPRRAWRLAVSVDQLANAAANGNEDETISSRANRARSEGRRWGCVLCRVLDALDPGHCKRSAGI